MSGSFDIVSTLGTDAASLVTVVGGSIAAALTVWVLALGARIGISKFSGYAKKG